MATEDVHMDEFLVQEAERLIDAAKSEGITLRLVGSIGFRELTAEHCDLHGGAFDREIGDIDLVGYKDDSDQIRSFFEAEGYDVDRDILLSGWGNRLVMYGEMDGNEYEVDIFLDEMDMCHKLNVRDRLERGPSDYALNPADLFLEKAQIVEINEKDLKDILALFAAFPVTTSDEGINEEYISRLLSKDWGFYFTVTNNLVKVREYLNRTDAIDEADAEEIRERITEIEERVESESKSIRWRLRSLVGSRWKWYSTVDEKHR